MTREQLDALARRYLSARFDEIEERLATETHPGARELISSELNDRAHELDAALTFGDYSTTVDRARKLIPGEDELTQLKLARRLIEVELEACVAEIAALGGGRLVMPSLASHAPASEEPKETPRFSEVVELFAEDKLAQNAWTARSEAQNRAMLAVVGELLGNPRIGDVTKDDIRKFALALPQLPSNLGKKFRGMSIRQVLEAVNGREDVPRLKPKTINTGFAALRAVFRWAIEHDLIRENPAIVLRDVAEGRARDQRVPFTDADIAAFAAAVDTPTRSTKHNGQPYMRWIPRILAYSGMRLGEVAQLRKIDVRHQDGIPVFDINVEDDKRTKNEASVRVVPVHPRLIELGFLDFVANQPAGYLWPESLRTAKAASRSPTDELSKLLMRRLRGAGVTDERKTIHSFRHTVSARLAAASIPEYQIADILGHENESMTTGRYGSGTPPKVKLDALSKLTLPM